MRLFEHGILPPSIDIPAVIIDCWLHPGNHDRCLALPALKVHPAFEHLDVVCIAEASVYRRVYSEYQALLVQSLSQESPHQHLPCASSWNLATISTARFTQDCVQQASCLISKHELPHIRRAKENLVRQKAICASSLPPSWRRGSHKLRSATLEPKWLDMINKSTEEKGTRPWWVSYLSQPYDQFARVLLGAVNMPLMPSLQLRPKSLEVRSATMPV
jgi:hypothetical protein